MNLPREDAYCPACPDPDTAFRIEDVGMRLNHECLDPGAGSLRITVSRPAWEPIMLAHLETEDDEAHRRLYNQCVAALTAAGMTAEESARQQVQATVDSVRRSMGAPLQPIQPPVPALPDRKVIQCNYVEATNVAAEGARAFVVRLNRGNGNDRIMVLVYSRGHRWVDKWENVRRLGNFRAKTLPPEHPLYRRAQGWEKPEFAGGLLTQRGGVAP